MNSDFNEPGAILDQVFSGPRRLEILELKGLIDVHVVKPSNRAAFVEQYESNDPRSLRWGRNFMLITHRVPGIAAVPAEFVRSRTMHRTFMLQHEIAHALELADRDQLDRLLLPDFGYKALNDAGLALPLHVFRVEVAALHFGAYLFNPLHIMHHRGALRFAAIMANRDIGMKIQDIDDEEANRARLMSENLPALITKTADFMRKHKVPQ